VDRLSLLHSSKELSENINYQATKELEKGWTMMKMAVGEPRWDQWVAQNLKEGAVVGYNPLLISARIFIYIKVTP